MATNNNAFDQIAESWYRVRHWPLLRQELEEVSQTWQSGTLLNIGCAHGPDFLPFTDNFELWGIDSSAAMLEQAAKYSTKFNFHASLISANALSLPFHDNAFDWVIAIATYHHIKGKLERKKAIQELRRVLKTGGEAFLTVWNHGQPRFWLKSKDQEVPWRIKGRTVYRYYHLFSYREWGNLLHDAGFTMVSMAPEKSYHHHINSFSRNICTRVKK